ncbi:MAG: hypothetical protein NVV59_02520 [Chitinophagaceae bacterium]|nr:hypothetical protein [Chitinophagaceae bacterium]
MLDLAGWWQSLAGFEKIFWGIALFFSLLFVIQTVFSFIAGDGDESFGDSDVAIGEDDGMGHGFFTIKNFIAFFTIFGWTGVALIKGNVNQTVTIAVAFAAGLAMVFLMVLLFRSMSKLRASGTLDINNAINQVAETYLFIPAMRGGTGKVHIRIQGSLRELNAITDDLTEIPTGKLVRVTGVVNNNVLLVTSQISS